ncbi:MAG: 2TM domain-containing protein [Bacteroidia bacterium]|nr:2TM domain-containing protein [Bacteroidia bacterium]
MKLLENNSQAKYTRAKKKLERIKSFYTHLLIYCIFVLFFIWLNLRSSDFPWALFPILGWGLGVLGHASETFDHHIPFGKNWEERKIKEFMQEEEQIKF